MPKALRPDTMITIRLEPQTSWEGKPFLRVAYYCPMGHDLGSFPVRPEDIHPHEISACTHYEHKES